MYKNFLNDTFKYRVYPILYIGGVPDVLEEAMVTDLVKNNIKGQYKEFKQCLTSEKGEHCLRCRRKEHDDSPIPRVIHNISAVVVVVLIGSFLFYLLLMN